MKNILLLSTFDNPAAGHMYSRYKLLKEHGENVFFLSYIRQYTDDASFFVDARNRYTLRRKIIAALLRFQKKLLIKEREYDFFNMLMHGVSAHDILKRTPFDPNIIIIGFYDYFLSPRTIHELYTLTHAKIVIPMVDAHILGGGCHYPCGCPNYSNGCKSCPALRLGIFARQEYQRKKKYLTNIPFILVGTQYDIDRANTVCFLKDKEKIKTVGTPEIPFNLTSEQAREKFGILAEDFVIMFGAADVTLKRKGSVLLIDALKHFSKVAKRKRVTLLVVGRNESVINISGINVVNLGYMNLEQLFSAFYASNLFVSPSIDDSGPYMVNYSIACGTPVLSFPIGISLDLVKHKETGFLACYGSSDGLCEGIEYFYHMPKGEQNRVKHNCLNLMEKLKKVDTPWYLKILAE